MTNELTPIENPQPASLAVRLALARDKAIENANRERIHAEIAEDLESQSLRGAMDWAGPCIVKTIAAGRIRHLTINY